MIGVLKAFQRRDPKRPWRSSPIAALLERGSIWFEEYWHNVKFTWVKGHSGNMHNVETDRLAGSARVNEQLVWSLKLGAPRTKFYTNNSFRKLTERVTSERSLGYKLLFGNIPVIKREVAWYPQAYPEPEMRQCPIDHTDEAPEETREYFLECTIGDPELPALQMGSAVAAWTDECVCKRTPMVGITQTDRRNAFEALRRGMYPHQRTARVPTVVMVRSVLQLAYRRRLAKNVLSDEDEVSLVINERRRRQRNTSKENESHQQPQTTTGLPETLSSSPPPELRTLGQHMPEPQAPEALNSSPSPLEMRTPERHTSEPQHLEEALDLFKLSSSPVRVSGTHVGVNAKFAAVGNTDICRVDKSLFCIGFWDEIDESGRICLPRRSGKTYNLIQLLLFFSMAPEEPHLDAPDIAIEELGRSAEQIRQMDIATKCRLKRTLLFKDSLLKEKHRAFFDEHFMKHPVIHISFSLCKDTPAGAFLVSLCDAIATSAGHWVEQYPLIEGVEVENTNIYLQTLQKTLAVYKDAGYDANEFASKYSRLHMQLFRSLSEFVGRCVGKYILLIDEYDIPFIHAHLESWSDEKEKKKVQNSLKILIQAMFKDNIYLRKGLLVGVFEVPLAELGSGANNIVDFPMVPFKNVTGNGSIVSATYKHSGKGLDALTDSFWFNTKEVEGLLEKSAIRFPQIAEHRDEVMAAIKNWYNGYHFGRFRGKYNPWSVCAFIGCLCSQLVSSEHGEIRSVAGAIKPAARAYWVATGTTDLIEQQFTSHRDQAIRLMESLIREYRETRLDGLDHDLALGNSQAVSLQLPKPNMNIISSGKYSTEGMLTLCLFAGYLTHKHPDSVCIPNHEVYNVWCTLFTRALLGAGFAERADVNARGSLLVELWEGKTAILSSFISEAFGTLTNHGKYKKEYANIVATVLTAASCLGALSHPDQASSHTSHAVTTRENHTGDGQCDHVMRLFSTDNQPNQFGVLIEFKLVPKNKRANTGLHETLAKKALDQIIEKRYPACLSGCTERLDIGIAIGSSVLRLLTQLYKLDAATRKWIPVECLTSSAS
ncbi:hypothetical protein LPJ74_004688 [Coemansia sp. RSA 1843]|nr:hypothetical protein LPJ74_004688 [Coemansia sp. RSA 1843]